MMFWLGVTGAYLTLIGVGLLVGHWLSARGQRGGGQGRARVMPPTPFGPTHAAEWQPLGSDFDRAFLPGAFVGDLLTADAA